MLRDWNAGEIAGISLKGTDRLTGLTQGSGARRNGHYCESSSVIHGGTASPSSPVDRV
jgi:hypothetical protein